MVSLPEWYPSRNGIRPGQDATRAQSAAQGRTSRTIAITRVCPSLSEVEDVPLKALCKTRILLVGFGFYNQTIWKA